MWPSTISLVIGRLFGGLRSVPNCYNIGQPFSLAEACTEGV